MDSIFGIGPLELALILIIAGIVMGPERMVHAARWLGQAVAQMQSISKDLRTQLEKEVGSLDEGGQLRETVNELKSLQREVSELRQQVDNTAVSIMNETQKEIHEIENSILPPTLAETKNKTTAVVSPPEPAETDPSPATQPDLPRVLAIPDDPE